MTKDQEEARSAHATGSGPGQSQEQQAALYGPAGRADHKPGDVIKFRSPTGGKVLTGSILYIRAPAPAIKGGKVHPMVYITYVEGEAFPRMVYQTDIIEEQ